MKIMRTLSLLGFMLCAAVHVGCDTENPTYAAIDNGYSDIPIYRAWWVTVYFSEPVPAGAISGVQRSVPVSDIAYALLAPGWDPASATPPTSLIPVRSKSALSVKRGETIHIAVSDQTFTGRCAAGQTLSQEDADFITQSIFPSEFAGATYDAATCIMTFAKDGGPDGG